MTNPHVGSSLESLFDGLGERDELEAATKRVALCEVVWWIPVEERLPERDGEFNALAGGLVKLLWFDADGWWDDSRYPTHKVSTVTHWAEMLKGPKL